jgi:hypothetical protein
MNTTTQSLTKQEFEARKKAYIDYMLMNIKQQDWHAVSDAANDLRVLEASFNSKPEKWIPEHPASKMVLGEL